MSSSDAALKVQLQCSHALTSLREQYTRLPKMRTVVGVSLICINLAAVSTVLTSAFSRSVMTCKQGQASMACISEQREMTTSKPDKMGAQRDLGVQQAQQIFVHRVTGSRYQDGIVQSRPQCAASSSPPAGSMAGKHLPGPARTQADPAPPGSAVGSKGQPAASGQEQGERASRGCRSAR